MAPEAPPRAPDGPLTPDVRALRALIYRGFARTGQAPTVAELAAASGRRETWVRDALDTLERAHVLALLPDRSGVWMAHPFSAVPTAYPVEAGTLRTWGNCAWDALGIPALLEVDSRTRTECASSGAPLEFGVRGGAPCGDAVVHMTVPLRRAWDDIGFT